METNYRNINTPADFTEDVMIAIETIFDGYYADEPRIDWFNFLDRVESLALVNFGSDMDSPAVKQVKKIVKGLRNAG
jgi:hypothetical protein